MGLGRWRSSPRSIACRMSAVSGGWCLLIVSPVIMVVIRSRTPAIRDADSLILVCGIPSMQLPTSTRFHARARWLRRAARPWKEIDTAARRNHNATVRPVAASAASITFPVGRYCRWLNGASDADAAKLRDQLYSQAKMRRNRFTGSTDDVHPLKQMLEIISPSFD